MSESWSRSQRQQSMTYPGIANLCMPPSSVTGSNRSRRPSWSDAKKVWNAGDEDHYSDSHTQILKKLDNYYRKVKRQILAFQSLTTGLFPNHLEPDKKVAHVVENVFCATAVWSLRQCYCKIDNDQGRAHELGQAAVKCMRGILDCWMRQAKKIEVFKGEQSPKDALHSKFNVLDGSEVEDADEVGQLQICAISIYLLTLVQMITSNLEIIFSMDEVNFVQQLIFYIERAYRTPDYGIWGRGSKYNTNTCELHATSIGMAKAALEAMNGFNLYGDKGANWSVVYVDVDAHNRNRTTFDTLLPRESASKNTDAALLLTVSWPTFAVHDSTLVQNTIRKCIRKLRGTHGFKRFLRDGQYTDLESKDQRFYEATEIKKFDKNECQWPMFYAVMIIDGIFKNNQAQVDEYMAALNPLLRHTTEVFDCMNSIISDTEANSSCSSKGQQDLSSLQNICEMMVHHYYVDHSRLHSSAQSEASERGNNQQLPFACSSEILYGNFFLFGQSVWIICQLLVDKLLTITDLDPIRRYLPPSDRPKANSRYSSIQDSLRYQYTPNIPKLITSSAYDPVYPKQQTTGVVPANVTFSDLVIHVVAISESVRLQQVLATYGIQTQTPKQVEPILIWPPSELVKAYTNLGINKKFGFSGRPDRPVGVLGTCKTYRICSKTVLCYPLTFETNDFYMSSDMTLLLDNIRSDFEFLTKCWRLKGRPIYLMMLRERHLRGPQKSDLLELLTSIRNGKLSTNIFVRLERLQTAISSACIEHLDFLNNSICTAIDWQSVAVHEYKNTSEIGQYKSLTDVSKTPFISEDIDYINSDFKDRTEEELREFICNTDISLGSLKKHALATYELYKTGGLDWMIKENYRVKNHLEHLLKEAATWQHWAVIRFVSSLLHKMVDSLAPSVTNLLVRGKTVTIGVFGHEETIIDKPIRPNEIFKILYDEKVFGNSIFHAVLLQEILINVSVFMLTSPQLFNGILKLRLGWLFQAMKLGLEHSSVDAEDPATLNTLSPNEIKQLVFYVLTSDSQQATPPTAGDVEQRSSFQKRQMDGALCRVPADFFEHVWSILERTPGGIKLCDALLPQQPTLSDMTDYELNFSLKIEEMLSRISDPAYRCLVVEMFELINVLLKRNSELRFTETLDVDYLINEAVKLYQQQTNSKDPYKDFYNLPIQLVGGSTGYMVRVIINYLFNANIQKADGIDLNMSTNTDICKIS
ncbi:unnamed protein product [Adineta steineri]|uniref:Phosphorylase b kinase regulatory subunit n=2 Tax=Adineta steineri TaxID=433720 RepID=A0A813TN45_9BILA|nr:unnamed protein product [Adineta steineri]CAF0871752.1 unnamed protein product [Adineta steineri]CAF3529185.1 unnamed protein product [Adineta steineri]CAF3589036.1 unnamed protein product [Adineta steineri]